MSMTKILALVVIIGGTGIFLYSQGYLGGGEQMQAPAETTTEAPAATTTDGS